MSRVLFPDYYEQFQCVAGACTDTCCAGWEIVIDPKTANRYLKEAGALGDRLRENILEKNGEFTFVSSQGQCPFLNTAGLCDISTLR